MELCRALKWSLGVSGKEETGLFCQWKTKGWGGPGIGAYRRRKAGMFFVLKVRRQLSFFVSRSKGSAISLQAFLLFPYLFSSVMSCHCIWMPSTQPWIIPALFSLTVSSIHCSLPQGRLRRFLAGWSAQQPGHDTYGFGIHDLLLQLWGSVGGQCWTSGRYR